MEVFEKTPTAGHPQEQPEYLALRAGAEHAQGVGAPGEGVTSIRDKLYLPRPRVSIIISYNIVYIDQIYNTYIYIYTIYDYH